MGTRMRTMAANRMGSAWESGESGAPTWAPAVRLMCAPPDPVGHGGFVSPGRRRLTSLGAVVAGESLGLPAVVEPAHLAVVRVEHVDKLLPCIGSEFAVATLRSPS